MVNHECQLASYSGVFMVLEKIPQGRNIKFPHPLNKTKNDPSFHLVDEGGKAVSAIWRTFKTNWIVIVVSLTRLKVRAAEAPLSVTVVLAIEGASVTSLFHGSSC